MPPQFLHDGIFLISLGHTSKSSLLYYEHVFPYYLTKITFPFCRYRKQENRKKNIAKQNSLMFPVDTMWSNRLFPQSLHPTREVKVIFPPCMWNQYTKIDLWGTSSIRNRDHAAISTRFTRKPLHGIATTYFLWHLPVLLRYANRNHIFLPVSHRHVSSTHEQLPCALYQSYRETEQRRTETVKPLDYLYFLYRISMAYHTFQVILRHTGTDTLVLLSEQKTGAPLKKYIHANATSEAWEAREKWIQQKEVRVGLKLCLLHTKHNDLTEVWEQVPNSEPFVQNMMWSTTW